MDRSKVYLVQTDTTVGFLSSDNEKLAHIKQRPKEQKILREVDGFKTLKIYTRVPKKFRKRIRNSKNTTFIYPNKQSFRVISKSSIHHKFIKKFKILYSTSANETQKSFNIDFATKNCDIEVLDNQGYFEFISSSIIKITNKNLAKIR